LDDQRPAPSGWLHARNYEEAVEWIRQYGKELKEVSLDHDLCPAHSAGDYSDGATGYDVLAFLLGTGHRPVIQFHTMNAEGMQRMIDLLEYEE